MWRDRIVVVVADLICPRSSPMGYVHRVSRNARIRRPTHATVVAYLALFVALGGSSYAAVTVTGKSVTNGSLTGADVKSNSITGRDVKGLRTGDVADRSLLARDFKSGQLPAGPSGNPGPQGPQGAAGPAGATNVVTRVNTAVADAAPANNASVNAGATCLPGERATGGGVTPDTTALPNDAIAQSYPTKNGGGFPANGDIPTGWAAIFVYSNAPAARTLRFYVVCARP